jgi:hypothetical protein
MAAYPQRNNSFSDGADDPTQQPAQVPGVDRANQGASQTQANTPASAGQSAANPPSVLGAQSQFRFTPSSAQFNALANAPADKPGTSLLRSVGSALSRAFGPSLAQYGDLQLQQYGKPVGSDSAVFPADPYRLRGDAARFGPTAASIPKSQPPTQQPSSLAQLAQSAPNAPGAVQQVQAHLANPNWDDINNGVHVYKGLDTNGVTSYSDTPMPGSQLTRMKPGAFAGNPGMYPQDTSGVGAGVNEVGMANSVQQAMALMPPPGQTSGGQSQLAQQPAAASQNTGGASAQSSAGGQLWSNPGEPASLGQGNLTSEQRQAWAQQLSAQRVDAINRSAALDHQNALLAAQVSDQAAGAPSPGAYTLPNSQVDDWNNFQNSSNFTRLASGTREQQAQSALLGLSRAKMAQQWAQHQGDNALTARGQDMNYNVATLNRDMQLRNYMAQRNMDWMKMQMDQSNKNRQFGLDQGKFGLEQGKFGLDQYKAAIDAQNANTQQATAYGRISNQSDEALQKQIRATQAPGPDGDAAAARIYDGMQSTLAQRQALLQQQLAAHPDDAQTARNLQALQTQGFAAMPADERRAAMIRARLQDVFTQKYPNALARMAGIGASGPVGGPVPTKISRAQNGDIDLGMKRTMPVRYIQGVFGPQNGDLEWIVQHDAQQGD